MIFFHVSLLYQQKYANMTEYLGINDGWHLQQFMKCDYSSQVSPIANDSYIHLCDVIMARAWQKNGIMVEFVMIISNILDEKVLGMEREKYIPHDANPTYNSLYSSISIWKKAYLANFGPGFVCLSNHMSFIMVDNKKWEIHPFKSIHHFAIS